MKAFLLLSLAAALFSTGLIVVRRSFHRLAYATAALLDAVLDDTSDERVKQRQLVQRLSAELWALAVFLFLFGVVTTVALAPVLIAEGGLKGGSTPGWIVAAGWLFGGTLPVLVFARMGRHKDHSEWSMLLHRMVLDHPHIGASLFAFDVRRHRRSLPTQPPPTLLISGLARSGTTALTLMLARSERFHALTYAAMPFVLCPASWSMIRGRPRATLRERSHGDRVLIGPASTEALEEPFFRVFLRDAYISADALHEHAVDAATFAKYTVYRGLVGQRRPPGSIYLTKNNNALLRYRSLREQDLGLKAVFLFRDPVEQARSLLRQHHRFLRMQADDPFVRWYMDRLAHHEFGDGLKAFVFTDRAAPEPADPMDLEHWVRVWIGYYTRLLELIADDANALLVDHADLRTSPGAVLDAIGRFVRQDLGLDGPAPFVQDERTDGSIGTPLQASAYAVHERLQARALKVRA